MTHSMEPSGFLSERTHSQATWRWRLLDDAGPSQRRARPLGRELRFPSQSDAETWVGEAWRDLREPASTQVVLLEGDREVYGPMSLQA